MWRRIVRVFRRRDLRIPADIGTEAARLLETDPGSPFTHMLLLMLKVGSAEALRGARENALARLDRLPPSRVHYVRGFLLVYPEVIDRDEGARLMRQGYAEAPDDADMVGLYAGLGARLGLPEGYAVFEQFAAKSPTHGIAMFDSVIRLAAEQDLSKNEKLVARLVEVWPEARGGRIVIAHLLASNALDEAEAAVAFGRRLGASPALDRIFPSIQVDLATGRTAQAREQAQALLASPYAYHRITAAHALATSLFLEGRADDALTTLADAARLGFDGGWTGGAAALIVREICARRWLGRPPADTSFAAKWLDPQRPGKDGAGAVDRALWRVQVALAADAPAGRDKALRDLEVEIEATADRFERASLQAAAVPLFRAVRGDQAAVAAWNAARHATPELRPRAAIDAGLALEALADRDGAADAYRAALSPATVAEAGLERVIAAARLAALSERGGVAVSASVRAIVERAGAPLRDAALRLK